ncbi:MAG TPA: rhomboid family intramembrane serine protease [Candidatus Eremiobacteraceae bacterium]|nr:rhomboid family intramembrane serine protease [Candidatus Eremiobacteraceae bacterium]
MYQRPGFYFPRLSDTPVVMGLILACGVFFVLHFVAVALRVSDPLPTTYSWEVSTSWIRTLHLWQPFTYPFVHTDVFGLLWDGLVLYFFAGSLERAWGAQRFLVFFFASSVLAGAVLMLFTINTGFSPLLMGLGAGIWLTLIVGFATLNPFATIYLMMIIPVQARWIAWGTIAIQIFAGYPLYGGPVQAIISVGLLALFAFAYTSRNFRSSITRHGPKGPSLKERFDRWQQRRRMRQWQRRVSQIERPEDLFKDK